MIRSDCQIVADLLLNRLDEDIIQLAKDNQWNCCDSPLDLGISCIDGRVTKLAQWDQDLGAIPHDIGNLDYLKEL